jgi:predicted nicotinamide N-methyase
VRDGSAQLAPGDELLDHPDADPQTVERSLHHIARSNRWFGGWWAVRHGLARLLADVPPGSRLTLLDVGTGAADLPRRAVAWARRREITLVPIGVERHRRAAVLARVAGVPTMLACAAALPLRPRSVDLVLASQLVHHLAPDSIVRFCQSADSVARRGVIIADLRRSRWAMAGFWFGSRLFRFDPATRTDGLTSVRRGFTPAELGALLARAGVRSPVERTPGFRLVAAWPAGAR